MVEPQLPHGNPAGEGVRPTGPPGEGPDHLTSARSLAATRLPEKLNAPVTVLTVTAAP